MRIRTILASAAAPLALGGVLLTATAASASTNPNSHSLITITSQSQLDQLEKQGPINSNIDIPAGVTSYYPEGVIWFGYATVNGNVSIEAPFVKMAATTVNGN